MHDLRHDPADPTDAHAPDLREPTWFAASDTATVQRVDVDELRTVPMPNLRSPEARTLDAEARDLRTGPERFDAEMAVLREALERLADSVTVLMLERELARLEREEAAKVLPMAEDAWGQG